MELDTGTFYLCWDYIYIYLFIFLSVVLCHSAPSGHALCLWPHKPWRWHCIGKQEEMKLIKFLICTFIECSKLRDNFLSGVLIMRFTFSSNNSVHLTLYLY